MNDEIEQSFQVGLLINYKKDDPTFNTIGECVKHAKSIDPERRKLIGIWTGQNAGSELIGICYEGEYFKKW